MSEQDQNAAKMSELTAEEIRARRLRTLAKSANNTTTATTDAAVSSNLQNAEASGQRTATNVSNSSRLVKASLPTNTTTTSSSSSSSVEIISQINPPLITDSQDLILPIVEQQKMDVDVEMKSLTTTPTKSQTVTLPPPSTPAPLTVMQTDVSIEQEISSSTNNKSAATIELPEDIDDAGIEKMETSEQPTPATTPQQQTSLEVITTKPEKSCNERLESMLSKILNATWNEYCTGSMICPQTASFLEHHPEKRYDFETLVTNVLMESVLRLYNDEESGEGGAAGGSDNDTDMKTTDGATAGATKDEAKIESKAESTPTYSTPKKIKSDDSEVQEIMANVVDDQPSTSRGLQSGAISPSSVRINNKCSTRLPYDFKPKEKKCEICHEELLHM